MSHDTPTYRKPIGTPRQVHSKLRIGDDAYDVCYPSNGDRINVLDACRKAGDLNAKNESVDEIAGMRFLARVAICCLYHPGGVRRVFSEDDLEAVKAEPWLDEHGKTLSAAFAGKTLEEARGNSSTTPS
ncbi:phage tail protein [Pyxidicoccus parkwayensis]|uniref:Phage tail protein n=1 Tax=Pyxidicoccus parkwayensis TaxID=2813578 RepID=A0ABX7NLM1_9BACT|nr:phage tail protein [Pyxidicoccus parkwaysis]QSQ19326.1 phage tail protein [Pyxidicoccus parkwaysis]